MEIFDRSLFSFREDNQKRKTSFLQVNTFSDLQRVFFGRRVLYFAAACSLYSISTGGVSPSAQSSAFGHESLAGGDGSELSSGWGEDVDCIFLNNFSK